MDDVSRTRCCLVFYFTLFVLCVRATRYPFHSQRQGRERIGRLRIRQRQQHKRLGGRSPWNPCDIKFNIVKQSLNMNTAVTFSILYKVLSGRSMNTLSQPKGRCGSTDLRAHVQRIQTVADCIDAMRLATDGGDDNSDHVWKRLVKCFRHSLPTDVELQKLSILQQKVEGTRGIEEYSVTTIWLCALQSIMETEPRTKPVMKRCPSVGCIPSRVPKQLRRRFHSF